MIKCIVKGASDVKRIDKVYNCVKELCSKQFAERGEIIGVSAMEIAHALNIQRTNASSDLNTLFREGKVIKVEGKPVLYKVKELDMVSDESDMVVKDVFDSIIGANLSLKKCRTTSKSCYNLSSQWSSYTFAWRDGYRQIHVCRGHV